MKNVESTHALPDEQPIIVGEFPHATTIDPIFNEIWPTLSIRSFVPRFSRKHWNEQCARRKPPRFGDIPIELTLREALGWLYPQTYVVTEA